MKPIMFWVEDEVHRQFKEEIKNRGQKMSGYLRQVVENIIIKERPNGQEKANP